MTVRSPFAAWRAGVRWPLVLLGFGAILGLALAVCEALGWPFLVGPLEKTAASALDRRVSLRPGGDSALFRIRLLGSVRIRATQIEVGSPSWSDAPYTLRVGDVDLKLRYLDLWRAWRGAPLNVAALDAAELDAKLEREADGRASWQFGRSEEQLRAKSQGEPAAARPTFGLLNVGAGRVSLRDAVTPAKIDASFALRDGSRSAAAPRGPVEPAPAAAKSDGLSVRAGAAAGDTSSPDADPASLAPGETGLRLKASGTYDKLPVHVDLQASGGALALVAEDTAASAQPVTLKATMGRTRVSFDGSTFDPLHLSALKGEFQVSGPSLAAVGDALGVTLPATPAFETRGNLTKEGQVWSAAVGEARIGSSRLSGDFRYDRGPVLPVLSGKLEGKRLVLADLGPAIGTPPGDAAKPAKTRGRGRVIPDKRFDLPSLRAMDANVSVDIAEFDTGTDVLARLRPLRAKLVLSDGVLQISDIEASTAKGRLTGSVQLDGRSNEAKWSANLGLRGVDLAQWLRIDRSGDAPPYLSGKLDAKVQVAGAGRSTAEILGGLSGEIRAHMRDASISHLAIEALGVDIAQALGLLVSGDDQLKVLCNMIDLEVKRGLIRPRVMVVNTPDSTLWIDGIVSLKTESLGLKAVVAPKDFSPLSLRTPVEISGTLSDPSVSLEAGKLAAKGGAAALLALLHPLAALLPFVDTGSTDEAKRAGAQCAELAARGGAKPRPPRR